MTDPNTGEKIDLMEVPKLKRRGGIWDLYICRSAWCYDEFKCEAGDDGWKETEFFGGLVTVSAVESMPNCECRRYVHIDDNRPASQQGMDADDFKDIARRLLRNRAAKK